MRVRSPLKTGIISSYSRAARLDRLRRKWLLPWRVRTSFPEPVYSKRRAAALWVFNFGIDSGGRQVYHTATEPEPNHQLGIAAPERAGIRHLRVPTLAHAERNGHLGHAKARPMRLDRPLELNPESLLAQRDGAKNIRARRPK